MSRNERYRTTADLPRKLPVFPLPGALVLPRADLPLNIFEPRYLAMVDDALSGDRLIGMIQPADEDADLAGSPELRRVGCAGRITAYAEMPDDRLLITLTGVCRFAINKELESLKPYRLVEPDFSGFNDDLDPGHGQGLVDRDNLLKVFRQYLTANDLSADWDQVAAASNESLVNTLSLLAPYPPRDKQALLEALDLQTRAEVLIALTEIALAKSDSGTQTRLQ
ncbi:MAG: LON peptidase substrate-binding domain-containing protein [Rhizobiales bacterium]|nr:LON peptidase substrate-binding domain-containing protein [Hyphomicrobiales bacterium]